eukprot:UN23179
MADVSQMVADEKNSGKPIGKDVDDMTKLLLHEIRDGRCSVTLVRALHALRYVDQYSFDVKKQSIDVIMAIGHYDIYFRKEPLGHAQSHIGRIDMFVSGGPTCLCKTIGETGIINGTPTDDVICEPYNKNVLYKSGNPTCFLKDYTGGNSCCKDGQFLLDQDQPIPSAFIDAVYLKLRVYYEEYNPAVHKSIHY